VIDYHTGEDVGLDEMIEVYIDSTLGERRPVGDRERMGWMLRNSNLVVTAREGGRLVGIARSVSDFHYATYLSDLAVCVSHQQQGIGMELIRRTQEAAPLASIVLLAAPAAVDYYKRIGFTQHESAWILRPGEKLRG
jgi:ribosomal protein S18 acetylase RimI-like enzyme